jgi:hypothetical protein
METNQIINALEVIIESLKQPKPVIDYKALNVGDVLPGGSIVVYKEEAELLIAAPPETEVKCQWSEDFAAAFESLSRHGFNNVGWFIPNVGQLFLAYLYNRKAFSATPYWSSTEASSTNSCSVYFGNGCQSALSKANTLCVRAFRRVIL